MTLRILSDWKTLDFMPYGEGDNAKPPQLMEMRTNEYTYAWFFYDAAILHCSSVKLPHDYEEGTDLVPFVNWAVPNNQGTIDGTFTLYKSLWKDSLGGTLLEPQTTTALYSSGLAQGADDFPLVNLVFPVIPGAGIKIGAIINLSLRVDIPYFSPPIPVVGIGIFYQANSLGSISMVSKS